MASSSSSSAPVAPSPASILLARGTLALLSSWSALRIAVFQNWGGPQSTQKRTWLAGVIVDAFTDNPNPEAPDAEYIEEMLLQIMEDEFDCVLEDGSAEGVAKGVVKVWDLIQNKGEVEARIEVERLEAVAKKAEGKMVEAVQGATEGGDEDEWSDSDDGDGSDMDEDDEAPGLLPPSLRKDENMEGPIVDEDGFTLVQSKGKSKR